MMLYGAAGSNIEHSSTPREVFTAIRCENDKHPKTALGWANGKEVGCNINPSSCRSCHGNWQSNSWIWCYDTGMETYKQQTLEPAVDKCVAVAIDQLAGGTAEDYEDYTSVIQWMNLPSHTPTFTTSIIRTAGRQLLQTFPIQWPIG